MTQRPADPPVHPCSTHTTRTISGTRAALVLTGTNTAPILKFLDPRGNARAWIGAMSDGKAQLLLMNRPQPTQPGRAGDLSRPNVAATATLEVDADGAMGLRFFRGGTIWKAP